MKVITFPHLCFLIVGVGLFRLFESGRMTSPTSTNSLCRNELVKHFVEDHTFDEVAWHKWLVEEAMNANDFLVAVVDAKTNGGPPTSDRYAHPCDSRLYAVVKIGLIEMLINDVEVDVLTFRLSWSRVWSGGRPLTNEPLSLAHVVL